MSFHRTRTVMLSVAKHRYGIALLYSEMLHFVQHDKATSKVSIVMLNEVKHDNGYRSYTA